MGPITLELRTPETLVNHDFSPSRRNMKRGSVYVEDGSVKVFLAEDTLFTVHTHFLVAHSPVFRDMLHVAQANEGEGSSEDRPIFLPQIRAADLDMLVRLIYTPCALPQASPLLTATVEQCLSLIKLLECWLMDDFLEGVRQVLRDVQWSLPDKIALGEGTDMGVGWSSGAWYDLVDRAVPPTLEEGERMGWKAYELVRHIRERAANLPALVRWGVICEHLRAAMPESFVRPAPPSPLVSVQVYFPRVLSADCLTGSRDAQCDLRLMRRNHRWSSVQMRAPRLS
ncbi:hypothetical protein HDZ31DRAFT_42715 [Schizophyllum fasciatum]